MKPSTELAPSKAAAAKTIFAALQILKKEGGELAGSEVVDRIRQTVPFSDWERETLAKTGYVRWESILHFYTVDCTKAGFLRKNKGVWYLTKEGEEALKLGEVGLLEAASRAYRKWSAENKAGKEAGKTSEPEMPDNLEQGEQFQKANLEKLEEEALAGIKAHLNAVDAYDFQEMVAALLRAMGYHTPFIARKGKDGGIDIIAYQDPLGATQPRIKVQVKHKLATAVPVDDIRSLKGLVNRDTEIGLFVTSGRFTSEAERFARETDVHLKLIKAEDFIKLWQEYYGKLKDEEKNMLPLHPIYFLGSNE